MVKAESRLDQHEKSMEAFLEKHEKSMEAISRRMELVDKKLEQSIKDQREFSRMQNQMNRYFLNSIKNGKK